MVRAGPTGSAVVRPSEGRLAHRLFFSLRQSPVGAVSAMGRGEAAEKLSPEEDHRTPAKGGLSRAGVPPRATMRQGVDGPCGIRGSWG